MVCVPSKEELLASIRPDMKLTKGFFRRIYGYGVTDESFPDKAIDALEAAGCSEARQYYKEWVTAYEEAYKAKIKPVAAWYRQECEREWEKRRKEGEKIRIEDMSSQELMKLLKSLTAGG